MDLDQAAERINQHPDLTARVRRGQVDVAVYGRPAGYVTNDDLGSMGMTATGWGKHLTKGALKVWQSLAQGE